MNGGGQSYPSGTNAFQTFGNTPVGLGLRTADPAAGGQLGTSVQAPFGGYSPWQSSASQPSWLQSGLTQSSMPITNAPVGAFGRWAYPGGGQPPTFQPPPGYYGGQMPGGSPPGGGPQTPPPSGGGAPPPAGGGPPGGGFGPPPPGLPPPTQPPPWQGGQQAWQARNAGMNLMQAQSGPGGPSTAGHVDYGNGTMSAVPVFQGGGMQPNAGTRFNQLQNDPAVLARLRQLQTGGTFNSSFPPSEAGLPPWMR